jgi:L-lactate dehydrogenase
VNGAYGIRDTCISVPAVMTRKGIDKHVEIKLWPKEMSGLQLSAKALQDTWGKVGN